MTQPLNAESVKQRADIVAVLGHYGSVRLRSGGKAGELVGECPLPGHAKSGTQPGGAFTVTPSTQMYYCFKCGVGGDVFELIKQIEGFSRFDQVVQHVAELIGMASDPVWSAGSVKAEHHKESVSGESVAESSPASAPAVQGKVVATYPYVDERGELLYEVVRYEPKDFKQRRPDPSERGGWSWKTTGMRRVLYRLPAVLAADEVFIVEGEKDVHTLGGAGLIATTASGGAKAPWLDEYSETLRGRRIIILPDQDQPGRERAAIVADKLKGIAASVIVVNVPTGKDVTEYLERGWTVDSLLLLVASAREQKQRDDIETRGLLTPQEIIEVFPGGANAFLQPKHGLKTGFHVFDEMTLGLHPGELTILAARPAQGKSSLALNIAVNIARRGDGVRFFSFEMSRESLLTRLLCSWARVDMLKFRAGYLDADERARIQRAVSAACELPLFIDDNASSTVEQIHRKITRSQERGSVALVVIDYLQLMQYEGSENRNQEVGKISRSLKIMARELRVPFLVLSQLNRSSEQRTGGHRPQLSDLRDSGNIEQDADLVTFIFREEMYKPDAPELRGQAEWIIAKQRNGPTGKVRLLFRHALTQFENYSGAMEVEA